MVKNLALQVTCFFALCTLTCCLKLNRQEEKPLVVMFRMESEIQTSYVARTIDSLKQHQYEFQVVNSVDGARLGARGIQDMTNVTFNNRLTLPQQGCWASHIMAWNMFEKLRRPIVSLEADTTAVREFDVDPTIYEDYDILFSHSHRDQQTPCNIAKGSYVTAGLDKWYGAGSLLFTGRRPDLVRQMLSEEIDLPIDHWLNLMWRTKQLSIGALCPAHFHQNQDHKSTIRDTDKFIQLRIQGPGVIDAHQSELHNDTFLDYDEEVNRKVLAFFNEHGPLVG